MCGRYVLGRVEDLSERFQLRDVNFDVRPTWNAAPTQRLPVITIGADGSRTLEPMRWGLLPRWRARGGGKAPEPINARLETLPERPMFRGLLARNRCVVPATGFYEWRVTARGKQPTLIRPTDQPLFGFAGLWQESPGEDGQPVRSFTLITGPPNEIVAPIHDRMVAILEPDAEEPWLDPGLDEWPAVEGLVGPYPAERMEAFPVSRAVNSPRADDPSLVEPVEDPDEA
jgi:putative SOS response-associated peptidase YedK